MYNELYSLEAELHDECEQCTECPSEEVHRERYFDSFLNKCICLRDFFDRLINKTRTSKNIEISPESASMIYHVLHKMSFEMEKLLDSAVDT